MMTRSCSEQVQYIGTLPLHGAMLKTATLLQGPVKKVGLTFEKSVF
jgi:hypothetical protein